MTNAHRNKHAHYYIAGVTVAIMAISAGANSAMNGSQMKAYSGAHPNTMKEKYVRMYAVPSKYDVLRSRMHKLNSKEAPIHVRRRAERVADKKQRSTRQAGTHSTRKHALNEWGTHSAPVTKEEVSKNAYEHCVSLGLTKSRLAKCIVEKRENGINYNPYWDR